MFEAKRTNARIPKISFLKDPWESYMLNKNVAGENIKIKEIIF